MTLMPLTLTCGVLSLTLSGCDTPSENAREGPIGAAAPQVTIPQERNAPNPQISPTHPATSHPTTNTPSGVGDEQHLPDTMRAGESTLDTTREAMDPDEMDVEDTE